MLSFLKKILGISSPSLDCFGRTDTGRVRKNNEDNFAILVERNLFIVADGMGGHKAGEVASRVAVESLIDYFSDDVIRQMSGNTMTIQHELVTSFLRTNEKVMAMAAEDAELQGMGCTLIACLVDGQNVYFCHVGDVRGYLATGRSLTQVTTDHSLVAGQTGNSSVGGSSLGRNIVTRGIGFPFPEEPELHHVTVKSGDRVLLCSDGLWGMLDDDAIKTILQQSSSAEEACDVLVQQANEAGGKDNVTAVVVSF